MTNFITVNLCIWDDYLDRPRLTGSIVTLNVNQIVSIETLHGWDDYAIIKMINGKTYEVANNVFKMINYE